MGFGSIDDMFERLKKMGFLPPDAKLVSFDVEPALLADPYSRMLGIPVKTYCICPLVWAKIKHMYRN